MGRHQGQHPKGDLEQGKKDRYAMPRMISGIMMGNGGEPSSAPLPKKCPTGHPHGAHGPQNGGQAARPAQPVSKLLKRR